MAGATSDDGLKFNSFLIDDSGTYKLITARGFLNMDEDPEAAVNSLTITSPGEGNFVAYDDDVYHFGNDGKQYKSVAGNTYSLVTSSAPNAVRVAAKVGRFIMTGTRSTLQWSAFNDPESWTIGQGTRAGLAVVNNPELGQITGITSGRSSLVFQEFGISRLTYVGSPQVFRNDPVSYIIGALRHSMIDVGGIAYFIGTSGQSGGVDTLPEGKVYSSAKRTGQKWQTSANGKVSDWISENFDTGASSTHRLRIPIYDRPRRQIIWGSGTGLGNA